MKIRLVEKGKRGVMHDFAKALGTSVEDNTILIPKSQGDGYITFKGFGEDFRVMINNYYLKEKMVIERVTEIESDRYILFSFLDLFEPFEKNENIVNQYQQPKVMVFSETVSSVVTFPPHTFFRAINIAINPMYLQKLVSGTSHPIISKIVENEDEFIFETGVTTEMIGCANDLISNNIHRQLERLFYKVKCEELLCYFFNKLMERRDTPLNKIHIDDIKAIYKIKDHLHSNLDRPPQIRELAKDAGMSEPKLRRLFKQTFGKGVFEYYQSFRMQEAARLLKEERLTVSEVGYQIGFTNLSHFSRVFEKYMGMKPKKWSMGDQY